MDSVVGMGRESVTEGAVLTPPPPAQTGDVAVAWQPTPADAERAFAAHRSMLEEKVAQALATLQPGESVELSLDGSICEEVAAGASGRLSVERTESGEYLVTLEADGHAGAGSAAPEGVGARAGLDRELCATLRAGTTLHFKTAEAVGDFFDAAVTAGLQVEPSTAVVASLSQLAGLLGEHAGERLAYYVANNTTVLTLAEGAEASAQAVLEFNRHAMNPVMAGGHVGGQIAIEAAYEYDAEKGVLRQTLTAAGEVDGAESFLARGQAAASGSVALVNELPLPRARLAELGSGDLSALFDAARGASSSVVVSHSGEATLTGLGSGQYTSSTTYPLGEGEATTEVELKLADHPANFRLDLGDVELELDARKTRTFKGKSLEDCQRQAREDAERRAELERHRAAFRTQN